MNSPNIALLDTSFFASCLKLKIHHNIDIFPSLTLLAEYVLVPLEIRNEVERFRPPETRPEEINEFLNNLLINEGFYRICSSYDTMILSELESIIDKGEAEIIAQSQKIEQYWIWIDNTRDTAKVEKSYSHFHFHNIITIVYLLHYKGLLPYSIEDTIIKVNKVYNHSIEKRLAAEQQAQKWLSING